ncbi:NUDIX hydrolase [Photobacterium piscicola]|uniref:NUDIX hydrolase n=1 Tax=Photobacterium piscicola TaxID=1378299 RepID=UPI00399A82AD
MNTPQPIDKLAWLHIDQRKLLAVRSYGKALYYIPGGKRDPGETDAQALIREIQEELSVDLVPESLCYANSFQAQAHGKTQGIMVNMTCYYAEYNGDLLPASEIEEIRWINTNNTDISSSATLMILAYLKAQDLID